MNFKKSASWWPYRAKNLIHFWQTHNFCERLSCDWSFLSSSPHKVMQDSNAAIQRTAHNYLTSGFNSSHLNVHSKTVWTLHWYCTVHWY
jgi:hypothetical protein